MRKFQVISYLLAALSSQIIRSQTVTVTYPNGGETLVPGATVSIQWNWTGSTANNTTIQLYKGDVGTTLFSGVTSNNGSNSKQWTIPSNQQPGSDYRIRVTVVGVSNDYSNGYFTIGSAPGVVTVTYPNGGETLVPGATVSIQWNWTGSTANNTTIQLYKGDVGTTLFSGVTSNNGPNSKQWTIPSNQLPGSDYRVNVTVVGVSNDYSDGFFTIGGSPPAAPTLVSPANGATGVPTSPTLSWNASSGASSYNLQVATSPSFDTLYVSQAGITATSYVISGLVPSTTCYWHVSASNTNGSSSYSNTWSFTTLGPPAAPTLVSPANGATGVPTSPTLSWNASSGATSYSLQVATSPSFDTLYISQTGITATSYVISGLVPSTTCYWHVSASNASGSSSYSNVWSFTTVVRSPDAPTLASPPCYATGVPTSPTFSWNGSSGATSYHLQVSPYPNFSAVILDTAGITSTSVAVAGLDSNSMYYWRVSASNASGSSSYSNVWSFTTVVRSPAAPTLVSPANGATGVPTSPTLSWNASSGATWYHLQFSTTSNFSVVSIDLSYLASTSVPITGLDSNATYFWRVSASNTSGSSSYSDVWSFTTGAGGPPTAPTLVSPANGAAGVPTSLTLSWNGSSGATSYHLQVSRFANFSAVILELAGITSTSVAVAGLDSNSTYYWHVSASNTSGSSPYSDVRSFTTASLTARNMVINSYSIDFGGAIPGQTITKPLIITNQANSTDSLAITPGSLNSPFSHNAISSFSIPVGQSKSIIVSFHPTSAGIYSQTWTISHNATNQRTSVSIQLGGSCIPRYADLGAVPVSIDFDTVVVGRPLTRSVIFTNSTSSNDSLVISASLLNPPFSHNAISSYTLVPGQSKTIDVTFSPNGAGTFSQTWTIHNTATNQPDPISIQLTGTAVSQIINMAWTPPSIAFGEDPLGEFATRAASFTNQPNSNSDLNITAGVLSSPFSHDATQTYIIPPGESRTINLSFAPTQIGNYNQSWSIQHNATNVQNPLSIAISGTALTGQTNYYQLGRVYIKGDYYDDMGNNVLRARSNVMLGVQINGFLIWYLKFNTTGQLRFNTATSQLHLEDGTYESLRIYSTVSLGLYVEYQRGDIVIASLDALSGLLTIDGKGIVFESSTAIDWFRCRASYDLTTHCATVSGNTTFGNPLMAGLPVSSSATLCLDTMVFELSVGYLGQDYTLNESFKIRKGSNGFRITLDFRFSQNGGYLVMSIDGGIGNVFEVESSPGVGSVSYDFLPVTTNFGLKFLLSVTNGQLSWTKLELTDDSDLSIGDKYGLGITVYAGSFIQAGGQNLLVLHGEGRYSISIGEHLSASINVGRIIIDGALSDNGFEFSVYDNMGIGDLFTFSSANGHFQLSTHPASITAKGTLYFEPPPSVPAGSFPITLYGGLFVNLEDSSVYLTTNESVSLLGWLTFAQGRGWTLWNLGTKNDIGMFVSDPLAGTAVYLQMTSLCNLSVPINTGHLTAGVDLFGYKLEAGISYEERPQSLVLNTPLITVVLTPPASSSNPSSAKTNRRQDVLDSRVDSVNYCEINTLFPPGLSFIAYNGNLKMIDSFREEIDVTDDAVCYPSPLSESIYAWIDHSESSGAAKVIYDANYQDRIRQNSEYDFYVEPNRNQDSVRVVLMIPGGTPETKYIYSCKRWVNAASKLRLRVRQSDVYCFVDLNGDGSAEDSLELSSSGILWLSQSTSQLYSLKPLKISVNSDQTELHWETSVPTRYYVLGGLNSASVSDTLANSEAYSQSHTVDVACDTTRYKYVTTVSTSNDAQEIFQGPFSVIYLRSGATGVKDNNESRTIPLSYDLAQNYPNPFNPSTTISYSLPAQSYVTLKLYNVLGQQVRVLVDGLEEPGYKTIVLDAHNFSSGVYFYRMEAVNLRDRGKSFRLVRKMLLLR
ncbi:MAG: choice-of-anchor D domain-containing protein [Bacteroidota bacterium]